MVDALVGNWRTFALRGIAALCFGVLVVVLPGLTLGVLASAFGLYALADGGLAMLVGARMGGRAGGAGWAMFDGAASLAVGVLTLLWPQISVFVLLLLAALRAVASGAFQALGGLKLRRVGGDWLLAVAGVVGVAFGALLAAVPSAWLLALQALASGAALTLLGVRLRALAHGATQDDGMMAAV